MATTFSNKQKIETIREPLFQVSRNKYRAPRSSQLENVETNLIKLDITRIYNELDNIDLGILQSVTYLVGDIEDIDQNVSLSDGLSYTIDYVDFYEDSIVEFDNILFIDTIDKVSSKLSRLLSKVRRLESGI